MTARAGTKFFLWHQSAAYFIPAWAAAVVGKVWEFFLKLLWALKNKHTVRGANLGFAVVIRYSDTLESILGFPTSNYQADWHLKALADCLLANLPFLYYTSMDKFSVETESTMAHWNPYKVSVLNKIRVHSYLCRSRNKNVGVMIKILVIIPTIEKDLTNCLIVKVFL